jgi:hypothetical protein
MAKETGKRAGIAASKVLRDDRSSKNAKTAAGSALSQRANSKPAKLSSSDADRAVKRYLSKHAS